MAFVVNCSLCGLYLGEAAGEIEIICPLCLQLRANVEHACKREAPVSGFSYQLWMVDVHKKAELIGDITHALYWFKSLDILAVENDNGLP